MHRLQLNELAAHGFRVERDPLIGHGASTITYPDGEKTVTLSDHAMQWFAQFDQVTLRLDDDHELVLEVEYT